MTVDRHSHPTTYTAQFTSHIAHTHEELLPLALNILSDAVGEALTELFCCNAPGKQTNLAAEGSGEMMDPQRESCSKSRSGCRTLHTVHDFAHLAGSLPINIALKISSSSVDMTTRPTMAFREFRWALNQIRQLAWATSAKCC